MCLCREAQFIGLPVDGNKGWLWSHETSGSSFFLLQRLGRESEVSAGIADVRQRVRLAVKVPASPSSTLRTPVACGFSVLSGAAHEAAAGHAFPAQPHLCLHVKCVRVEGKDSGIMIIFVSAHARRQCLSAGDICLRRADSCIAASLSRVKLMIRIL